MNEPLYKTFLTAKLSPRSNIKLQDNTFFTSHSLFEKCTWSCKRKTSLKITWNSKTQGFDLNCVHCFGSSTICHGPKWFSEKFDIDILHQNSFCPSSKNISQMKNGIRCQRLTIYSKEMSEGSDFKIYDYLKNNNIKTNKYGLPT